MGRPVIVAACLVLSVVSTQISLGQPSPVPRLKLVGENGKPPRVLPYLGEKEPLMVLAAAFSNPDSKSVGALATKDQVKSDLEILTSAFKPKGTLYVKAVERKLIKGEPLKLEVEYLTAAAWWEYRLGTKAVAFEKRMKVEEIDAILDGWVRVCFKSDPAAAQVFIDGVMVGKTSAKPPRLFQYLKTSEKYEVRVSKGGFKSHEKKDYMPPKDGEDYEVELKP